MVATKTPGLRTTALWLLAGLFFAVAAFFAWRQLEDSWPRMSSLEATDLQLFAGAVLSMLLAVVGIGVAWGLILTYLEPGRSVGQRAVTIFLYSWPAHYVPGTLPYHAARVLLAERLGPTKGVVATSIAYENILLLAAGGMVSVIGLVLGLGAGVADSAIYLVLLLPLVMAPLALRPRFLVPVANRLLLLAKKPLIPEDALLSTSEAAVVLLAFGLVHLLNGFGFYLLLQIWAGDTMPNPALAIGAYTVGGIAGIVVLFVPSGIGVREGVLVALMSAAVSPPVALLAAATARAASVAADLTAPVAAGIIVLASRWLRATPQAVEAGSTPEPADSAREQAS